MLSFMTAHMDRPRVLHAVLGALRNMALTGAHRSSLRCCLCVSRAGARCVLSCRV
jgi:hypothetical protein